MLTLDSLAGLPRHVVWRLEPQRPGGPPTKVPYQPNGRKAATDKPATWVSRNAAQKAVGLVKADGVGIILGAAPLASGEVLAGIDLDACLSASRDLAGWATSALKLIPSYTEISPSGTGLKVFFLLDAADWAELKTAIGGHKRKWSRGTHKHPPAIELHLDRSYFTVTGQLWPGSSRALQKVSKDRVVRLVRHAEKFKAGTVIGRSEKAIGLAARVKSNGGTRDDFEDALSEDDDTASWATDHDQRQIDRAWERSADGKKLPSLGLNEDAIADLFARKFKGTLRFSHHNGRWYEFDGNYWRQDETQRAFNFARKICRAVRLTNPGKSEAKAFAKAVTASAVEKLARADQRLAVSGRDWDKDPWLLGTPGGVIDLQTGELREGRPEDLITKQTAVAPADAAFSCPLGWLQFLYEATGGNRDYMRFLQQWCGYCLTGDVTLQKLLFLYGPGGNGKGVFKNTVSRILGDYARNAAMQTFAQSHNERHLNELARLDGARLVVASETESGKAWDEARIKQLTGGDKITANYMRQNQFEFFPQFKLMPSGNNRPTLRSPDPAIRRRFLLGPFENVPEVKDEYLEQRLEDEWPEILGWMLAGLSDYLHNGLFVPECVQAATDEYLTDQDVFGRFIAECCTRDRNNVVSINDLWISWEAFAKAEGGEPGSKMRTFPDQMRAAGFVQIKDSHGIRGRGYKGLALKDEGFDDDL